MDSAKTPGGRQGDVSGHKISGDIKEPTLSPKAVRASSVGRGVARAVVWKKIGLRGSGHELGHPVQQEVTLAGLGMHYKPHWGRKRRRR